MASRAFNFALSYFVPPAFVDIRWKVYILFGVFLAAMFIHVFFMFPETANKTLEEVESIFLDPQGISHIGTPAWKTRANHKRIIDVERHGSVAGEPKGSNGRAALSEERVERGSSGEGSSDHEKR